VTALPVPRTRRSSPSGAGTLAAGHAAPRADVLRRARHLAEARFALFENGGHLVLYPRGSLASS
jgi:hypothetical protein